MTLEPKQAWQMRDVFFRAVRRFFHERDYCEVDTPIAVVCPGTEVHLNYFQTTWTDHKGIDHPLWLRSSPELHLKQVLASGVSRVFQIAKCFRNGGELSYWHHPEFSMLEWYRSGATYSDFMTETLDLVAFTRNAMHAQFPEYICEWDSSAVTKLTLAEAFLTYAKVELIDQDEKLAQKARIAGVCSVHADDDFETAFFKTLIEKIDPALREMEAVILYDYPASQAALARVVDGTAKRFELYWQGVELCNAFLELTDPQENLRRFQESSKRRQELGSTVPPADSFFHQALEQGLPASCGNALGLDRLLALLCGFNEIDPIIPLARQYPFSRPHF